MEVIKRLEKLGYPTYLVGGCVRDSLLGRPINDVDLTTLAKPNEIEQVFTGEKIITVGKRYGTIKVILSGIEYEITTFRSDGEYEDGRHPNEVQFSTNLIDDLKRRDFTINSMAINSEGKLIDPFGGKSDLKRGFIRAVGSAEERIKEDYLRSLRAVRFATIYGFEIEENLKLAISSNVSMLSCISYERIASELSKILLSESPFRGLTLLNELDLLAFIVPEIKGFVDKDIDKTKADLETRLSFLFRKADVLPEFVKDRLIRLRFSSKVVKDVVSIVKAEMTDARLTLLKIGETNTRRLIDIEQAWEQEKLLEGICIKSRKDLAITGSDLIGIGIPQGKEIGETLSLIEKKVALGEWENKKEKILDKVKSL